MIEIDSAFAKDGKAFITFLTAGDPSLEDTARYIRLMQDNGADLIEVGIPFSDPIAEGPVIQAADIRALSAGTDTDKIFDMLEGVEKKVPIVFMSYLNPIFFYGYDKFFARCVKAGVCGVIVPDAPFEESGEIKSAAAPYGITVIDMVAPTSEERINKVCAHSKGFIYFVSSMGVTGMRKRIETDISSVVSKIRKVSSTPVCVGFGISDPVQASQMASASDGAIIGSAIVKIIEKYGSAADEKLKEFVSAVSAAVHAGQG